MSARLTIATLVFFFLGAFDASAHTWGFSCPPKCANRSGAGVMTWSEITYDEETFDFAWNASFDPSPTGLVPRGLFIAVTNGPHPRDALEDVAILYGDGWTNRVTAYQYDDVLNHQSWSDPNGFIESFADSVSFELQPEGSLALSLSINVAGINAFDGGPDWAGVRYGPTIGVLAAALENDETEYGPSGELLDFDFGARTSYDRFERATTPMPEPNAFVLFTAGALVVGFATRRRSG